MKNTIRRALSAYIAKGCMIDNGQVNISAEAIKDNGRTYIKIFDNGQESAVYRVKTNGVLRAMTRPPKAIMDRGDVA